MKKAETYTLGEIRTLLLQFPNPRTEFELRGLFEYIEVWEEQAKKYQVQSDRRKIDAPQEPTRRQLNSLDAELLNSCAIVYEANQGG